MKYPFILKLFALFLFFLPLRFFEIPGSVIGFSINFARFFALLVLLVLFMNVCLDVRYLARFLHSGRYHNPYVIWLFVYFIFSIGYYYVLLAMGQTFLFADKDSFFRNWQGRPIAQLAVFFTYGVIPLYVVSYYAQVAKMRMLIERVLVWSTFFILYYGYLQQILYKLGGPGLITGRTLFDDNVLTLGASSFMLRFYSFAGEPRDFGTFMIGALVFYWYTRSDKLTFFTKLNLVLMFIAVLFTISTSAFIAGLVSLVFIFIDVLWRQRVRIKSIYMKYILVYSFVALVVISTGIGAFIADRPLQYFEDISSDVINKDVSASSRGQAQDLVLLYYIREMAKVNPFYLIFGYGYAHFLNPVVKGILETYFATHPLDDPLFTDTRSYLNKMIIETGLVGGLIYGMMFLYTLKLSSKLLFIYRKARDRIKYKKALLLRFCFIVLFVSSAVHISFYYFIIMGLIIGWLNAVVKEYATQKLQGAHTVIAGNDHNIVGV